MNDLLAMLRASAWWLAPLVVLVGALGFETRWGQGLHKSLPAAEPIPPKPVVTALLPEYQVPGGVAARGDTVNRTLFNPTRRPAPALAAEAAKPKLQRGQFALTGTTVIDGKSTAFLREVASGKARRVLQGEQVNGMTVAEVRPDRIRFTLGDESEELTLKVALNPKATVQPTAPPPGGGATGAPPFPAGTPPGASAVPTPPAAPGAAPVPGQSLAERREAARAAAAAAAAAAQQPAAATPAAGSQAAPAVDPRWGQMEERYRGRITPGAGTK